MGVDDLPYGALRGRDAGDQQHAEGGAHGLGDEGHRHPGREQEGTEGRPDQLVEGDRPGLQSCVGDPEVPTRHEHRQQGAAGAVGEDLRGPHQQHGHQDHEDVDLAGRDGQSQHEDDDDPERVPEDHHPAPVEPVGERSGVQPEDQPRQALQHGRQRDEERAMGLGGDQQRAGRERQPVPELADPAGGEQPPEARAETRRRHGVDDAPPDSAHETVRLVSPAGSGPSGPAAFC
jgi:hypothetical protein